jgi:glucokinase
MILAGDIGGTNTRIALFDSTAAHLTPIHELVYPSNGFPGLAEIALRYLAAVEHSPIQFCCFGVSGPVVDGKSHPTNLPWQLDSSELSESLGADTMLINDLEANAYGISALRPEDFVVLQEGKPERNGNAAVISAGTGLGEAGLYWDGYRHRPFACEGGHASFSPTDELEVELLRYLMHRYGHVSWERVLSGPGLFHVYEFLRDTGRGEEPAWLAERMLHHDRSAVVSEAALNGESDLCVAAMDLFVALYGAEAGNLALKIMALGGVYLGGGIAPRILPRLKAGGFLEAFRAKGRLGETLADIPVRVIVNDKASLIGAGRCGVLHMQ